MFIKFEKFVVMLFSWGAQDLK